MCRMPSFLRVNWHALVACKQHAASGSVRHLRPALVESAVSFTHVCAYGPVAQDPDPMADANFGGKFSDGIKDSETLVGLMLVA